MSRNNSGRRIPLGVAALILVTFGMVVNAGFALRSLLTAPQSLASTRTTYSRVVVDWQCEGAAISNPATYSKPSEIQPHIEPMLDLVERNLGKFNERPVVHVVEMRRADKRPFGYISPTKTIVVPRFDARVELKDLVEHRLCELRGGTTPRLIRDAVVHAIQRPSASTVDWHYAQEKDAYVLSTTLLSFEGKTVAEIAAIDEGRLPNLQEAEKRVRAFNNSAMSPHGTDISSYSADDFFKAPPLVAWDHYNPAAFDSSGYTRTGTYSSANLALTHWQRKHPQRVPREMKLSDMPAIDVVRREFVDENFVTLLAVLGAPQLEKLPGLRPSDKEVEELKVLRPLTRAGARLRPTKESHELALKTASMVAYALYTSGYTFEDFEAWGTPKWQKRPIVHPAPEGQEVVDLFKKSSDARLQNFGD